MITVVAFAVAAGLGGIARAEAGHRWNQHEGFPFGTLVVNVVGSFLLGLLWSVGPPTVTVVGVAGLGAFTTFSSFSGDTVALADQRGLAQSALYVVLSTGAGIIAAALGVALA